MGPSRAPGLPCDCWSLDSFYCTTRRERRKTCFSLHDLGHDEARATPYPGKKASSSRNSYVMSMRETGDTGRVHVQKRRGRAPLPGYMTIDQPRAALNSTIFPIPI